MNANDKRDARLRRNILVALDNARRHAPTGELSGEAVRDAAGLVAAFDGGFEDEAHCIALCRDLVLKQLATERVTGMRQGDRLRLRHLVYRLAPRGLELLQESIPPVAGVEDERLVIE